jgi:hypothetical protein
LEPKSTAFQGRRTEMSTGHMNLSYGIVSDFPEKVVAQSNKTDFYKPTETPTKCLENL